MREESARPPSSHQQPMKHGEGGDEGEELERVGGGRGGGDKGRRLRSQYITKNKWKWIERNYISNKMMGQQRAGWEGGGVTGWQCDREAMRAEQMITRTRKKG